MKPIWRASSMSGSRRVTLHGVRMDHMLGGRQGECGRVEKRRSSALAASGPRGKACITAEHPSLIVLGEPGPFILDLAFDVPGARRADRETNLLAGRRKLDGVGQE